MTNEEIRKAACDAYEAEKDAGGSWLDGFEAVYRAGMEAGRAEAIKRAVRSSGAETAGDMAAFLRRLENDPEEAARLLGGAASAKPRRRKADPCTVQRPEMVEEQTWADWLKLRKDKKAPVTQTVLNAATKEAIKAGMTLEAFLQVWCYRGSQGLEAAWLTPQERSKGLAAGRIDRQLETAGLMTGSAKRAPADMGEIYDVGQQRITSR